MREFLLVSYWNKKEKLKEANRNQNGEIKSRGCFVSKPIKPSGLKVPAIISTRLTDEVVRWSSVHVGFWKKVLVAIHGGGIRRRLMMWGLSLFGIALTVVVVAGYSYTVSQIKKDATQLQMEIASVTAERIRTFVQQKIERVSDTADAVSLYQLGSKEQQLLIALLVKNDNSLTEAAIIDAHGMEVVKVSDRKVYFPRTFPTKANRQSLTKPSRGRII